MFLFGQTNFDNSNSPQSEDEIEELTEGDHLSIEQSKEIQQQVLEQEELAENVQTD